MLKCSQKKDHSFNVVSQAITSRDLKLQRVVYYLAYPSMFPFSCMMKGSTALGVHGCQVGPPSTQRLHHDNLRHDDKSVFSQWTV